MLGELYLVKFNYFVVVEVYEIFLVRVINVCNSYYEGIYL